METYLFGDEKVEWFSKLVYVAAFIGAWQLTLFTTKTLYMGWCNLFRWQQNDLLAKYGTNNETWAVVTGGSDGIGLAFCHELAEQGFNICLISRNQSKIEDKLTEIKAKYPQLNTRCVVADFSKLSTIKEYNELVERELKDLDIGMLCLNAGIAVAGCVDQLRDQDLQSTYGINILHVAYMTKALAPKQLAREKRSGFVITGSAIAPMPIPGIMSYASSKAFVRSFGEGLHYELKSNIDVLTWEPGTVDTKILAFTDEKPPSCIGQSPQGAVKSCLRHLGKTRRTPGSFKHDWQSVLTPYFPLTMLGANIAKKERAKFELNGPRGSQ